LRSFKWNLNHGAIGCAVSMNITESAFANDIFSIPLFHGQWKTGYVLVPFRPRSTCHPGWRTGRGTPIGHEDLHISSCDRWYRFVLSCISFQMKILSFTGSVPERRAPVWSSCNPEFLREYHTVLSLYHGFDESFKLCFVINRRIVDIVPIGDQMGICLSNPSLGLWQAMITGSKSSGLHTDGPSPSQDGTISLTIKNIKLMVVLWRSNRLHL
jgi:hypothetical protein